MNNIPFHKPSIGEEEINSVANAMRSSWLTTGYITKSFEEAFRSYISCKHAIAVNSCTAALHLALDAVGVKYGDEVIIPTMTFAATGEVVTYFKARPILIDCEENSLQMDPELIEKAISERTKAIVPVHYSGHPCDMDRIMDIARRYNLKVIEDAAHALPAHYNGKMIGTIGDITCFSFYATKTITTGEGGMITTGNDEYAERMRIMSLHGISKDAWKRYTAEGSWYYEILDSGYKYNMTDIAAAIGVEQLKKCERFWKFRQRCANLYNDGFKDLPEVIIPKAIESHRHAWHLYVIQLELDKLKISRSEFIELLQKRNIGSSVHFIPLHRHPYYKNVLGYDLDGFPNANRYYECIVSLPIYPDMSEKDVAYVIEAVRNIITENRL